MNTDAGCAFSFPFISLKRPQNVLCELCLVCVCTCWTSQLPPLRMEIPSLSVEETMAPGSPGHTGDMQICLCVSVSVCVCVGACVVCEHSTHVDSTHSKSFRTHKYSYLAPNRDSYHKSVFGSPCDKEVFFLTRQSPNDTLFKHSGPIGCAGLLQQTHFPCVSASTAAGD